MKFSARRKETIKEFRDIIKFKSYNNDGKRTRNIFNVKDRKEIENYLSGFE